jgi:Cyclic-phosphate processing Receiver domain
MRLWLDDVRKPPDDSWTWAQNAEDFSALLADYGRQCTEISFDHDISSYDYIGNEITGYHCLCWVEKKVYNGEMQLPKMTVHSANPAGRKKMELAIQRMQERGVKQWIGQDST